MDTDIISSILGVFILIVLVIAFGCWCSFMVLRTSKKELSPARELHDAELQAVVASSGEASARLYPTGREVFFPAPPFEKPVYEVTFSGVLHRTDGASSSDAFYRTGDAGNFHRDAKWLRIKGYKLEHQWECFDMVRSDRCEHRYTIRIDGHQGRLTIALECHPSGDYDDSPGWSGWLAVQVRVLPEGTPGIADLRRRAQERREADRKSAEFGQKFSSVIQALSTRAELFANWGDPAFREQFARSRGMELISREKEIRAEANQLLEQHQIVGYFRRHNPVVLERLLGKLETLRIAEKIAVEPREKPAAPPRPRLSVEEVRERMCRRIEVQGGDRRAVMTAIITEKQEQIEMLDQFPLSEDEREQQVREIEDWAAGQLMKLSEGKEAGNANYQTLK